MLKSISFIVDKLYRFVTNQFINRYNKNYNLNSIVPERQKLIQNFGFTPLILREFIYKYWIVNDSMDNILELNKVLRKTLVIDNIYFTYIGNWQKLFHLLKQIRKDSL